MTNSQPPTAKEAKASPADIYDETLVPGGMGSLGADGPSPIGGLDPLTFELSGPVPDEAPRPPSGPADHL